MFADCRVSGHLGSDSCTCFGAGSGRGNSWGRGELLALLLRGLGLGLGVTDLLDFCFGEDLALPLDEVFCSLGSSFISPEGNSGGGEVIALLRPRFLRRVLFLV